MIFFSKQPGFWGSPKRQLLKSQYQQPTSGFILKTQECGAFFLGLQELAKRLAHVSSLVVSQHLGRCWVWVSPCKSVGGLEIFVSINVRNRSLMINIAWYMCVRITYIICCVATIGYTLSVFSLHYSLFNLAQVQLQNGQEGLPAIEQMGSTSHMSCHVCVNCCAGARVEMKHLRSVTVVSVA